MAAANKPTKSKQKTKGGKLEELAPAPTEAPAEALGEAPAQPEAPSQALAVVKVEAVPILRGRHSATLPLAWLSTYEASLASRHEQIRLTHEIALVDSLISDLTRQLKASTGEEPLGSVGDWREAVFAYKLLRRGIMERDKRSQNEAYRRLDAVFETAGNSRHVREELRESITLRRRLVESEGITAQRIHSTVPVARVNRLLAAMFSIVEQVVTKEESTLISRKFTEIIAADVDKFE